MSERFSAWWFTLPTWRASLYVGLAMSLVLLLGAYVPRAAESGWTDRAVVGLVVEVLGGLLIWWGIAAAAITLGRR